MRTVIFSSQPDPSDPLIDQPRILPCAQMVGVVIAARKGVVVERPAAVPQSGGDTGPRGLKQFELNGPSGLLLHYGNPQPHPATADEIADPNFDDVTAPQLAVYGEIKQSAVTQPPLPLKPKSNGPYLLRLERSLGA
jgi:hypothetical protein